MQDLHTLWLLLGFGEILDVFVVLQRNEGQSALEERDTALLVMCGPDWVYPLLIATLSTTGGPTTDDSRKLQISFSSLFRVE